MVNDVWTKYKYKYKCEKKSIITQNCHKKKTNFMKLAGLIFANKNSMRL